MTSQAHSFPLNSAAVAVCQAMQSQAESLRVGVTQLPCGATLIDCGIQAAGGLQAGLGLARLCLADQAQVAVVAGDRHVWSGPWIQVTTDAPALACMSSQYAGWPVKLEKFFAMGSGPMRTKRGKEPVLQHLSLHDPSPFAVGVLECDKFPSDAVCEMVAGEAGVTCQQLWLAVAPTRSLAGVIQVVARSVETALHKCHELELPLEKIISAHGIAPLPPPATDFALGIGRTNDAILYGAQVTLWVDLPDALIESIGPKIPSCASRDYGRPFAEVFAGYEYDFYKVDPGLFSPAEITICSLQTGRSWRFGGLRPDLIDRSFGTQASGQPA